MGGILMFTQLGVNPDMQMAANAFLQYARLHLAMLIIVHRARVERQLFLALPPGEQYRVTMMKHGFLD